MKKFAVLVAVVALFAVAAPTFAATSPFMDVPMNSWAYDAIASLASKGVLSGYPDGLYKGKQAMTRYEAASAIARALAYVDMTKADKQDVEMLKKLVVEFKDELDALGVRVDGIEGDFKKMQGRLGGWKISGQLRMDLDWRTMDDRFAAAPTDYRELGVWNRARLQFERSFGENESMYFYARIQGAQHDTDAVGAGLFLREFFVRMPFYADSQLTVGRFAWVMDTDFFGYSIDPTARYGTDSWFSDYRITGFGFNKPFGIGNFRMTLGQVNGANAPQLAAPTNVAQSNVMALTADLGLNLHEKFKGQIGGQYLSNQGESVLAPVAPDAYVWSKVFTGWFGLDFKFMEGVALKGMLYYQSVNLTDAFNGLDAGGTAYRLGLSIGQEILKFTDFRVEYAKIPENFYIMGGYGGLMMAIDDGARSLLGANVSATVRESKMFRLSARQTWDDKWSSWLFWERLNGELRDASLTAFGIGVAYQYNPTTAFALNYIKANASNIGVGLRDEGESRVRFTTHINF